MEELEKLRKEIDKLDKMIAELISKRQGLSNKILEAKGGKFIYDPVRERKDPLCLDVDAEALHESIILFTVPMGHVSYTNQIHQPYEHSHLIRHVVRKCASGSSAIFRVDTSLQPLR